ncbi:unnamed protein product [Tilletia laevis]|uniref:Uncharacterized protein n=1 Tax=Tilletia laevis TaxID=157183 RepID=A0A9N8QKZ3_9BASI|nr:unnamed protein product [Tilletia laevis]
MTAFLWFILGAVPVVALVLAFAPFFFDKKRRGVGEYDPKTGIGRGAPGFLSPEEIEAAQREAAEAAAKGATIGTSSSLPSASGSGAVERTRYNEVVNEWLPENLQGAAGARKGKKKAGKR